MKTILAKISSYLLRGLGAILAIGVLAIGQCTQAQTFGSGSDGSFGPMNITNNTTLPLPANGIFNCTTISVASGATLKFLRNELNTPVYLLATGDVVIAGTIDVSGSAGLQALAGEGGPGGFDGGFPAAAAAEQPGDGFGPGGGKGGAAFPGGGDPNNSVYVKSGSFGTVGRYSSSQVLYGNTLLLPLIGGSGGGGTFGNPGVGGGGGGGAVLIASSTSIRNDGAIVAQGGFQATSLSLGAGSGGGIRVVAPRVFGTGAFDASSNNGGFGIIRLDSIDRSGWSFSFNGKTRSGKNMVVFPTVIPRLDIIAAAGQVISEGTSNAVSIQLSHGASTNQLVQIQARNFTNDVAIRLVVTPENGSSTSYDTNIVVNANPANVTIPVVLTAGYNRINAWTR